MDYHLVSSVSCSVVHRCRVSTKEVLPRSKLSPFSFSHSRPFSLSLFLRLTGAIAAKLAFLPPEPSYSFSSISNANGTAASANNSSNLSASLNSDLNDTNGLAAANNTAASNNVAATPAPPLNSNQSYIEAKLNLTTRAEWQYTPRDLAKIEVCWSRTSKNNRIACMYVKAVQQPKFVILFSHGNAIDLGQMSSFYLSLGSRINCNVFR